MKDYIVCTLFSGLLTLNQLLCAQAIDNTASFRMVNADAYIRFQYENDFFTAKDYYYTQGINLEVVHPSFTKFFLNKILVAPKADSHQFGISIEHNGYTPTSITYDGILYGDRPFTAALMFKNFSMSANAVKRRRITTSLTLGVIGPAAGGYWMQSTIHRWVNDVQPLGWKYQIQNDVIVNYEASIEKNWVRSQERILVNTFAAARIGTLNTKLSSGLVIMAGRIHPRITSIFAPNENAVASSRKFNFHFYIQPMINLVGYDATLQGGLFNASSPYTIPAGDVERFTFQINGGLVISAGSVYLEYFRTYISKEFETGLDHKWGGVRVGVRL